jgi:hypothetical protein
VSSEILSLFFISGVVVDDFEDFLSEAPELLLDLFSFYYFFSSLGFCFSFFLESSDLLDSFF